MDKLAKLIKQKPKPVLQKSVESSKNLIEEATDKIYRQDDSSRGWTSWLIGIVLIIVPSIMILFLKKEDVLPKIIFWIIFGLPGIFAIIYGFVAPKKEIIFNRYNDRITVPRVFRKSVNIPFSSGIGVQVYSAPDSIIVRHLTFASSMKKPRVGGIVAHYDIDDSWAFMVWYMDKNRPLPPGDAFDPYREKDFERRKAEGFPKPLYKSNIPTPEFTKAQQQERERIGGW